PAVKPEGRMVKFGGRLARTTWALTAIWLGDGRWGRCRARIQRLLRPARGRTFHDLAVWENVRRRWPLRPRGGRGQGQRRPGEGMDRVHGLGSSLALPLAPRGRAAHGADDCRRWVE